MKKIISLVCIAALMITTLLCSSVSVFAAETDLSLTFNRYEEKNGTLYLFVDLELAIPELSALEDVGEDDYSWYGKVMNSLSWGVKFNYAADKLTFNAKQSTSPLLAKATASGSDMVKVAWADVNSDNWYSGSNLKWTLAFKVIDKDYTPVFEIDPGSTATSIVTLTGETSTTPNDNNTVVYKATVTEAAGNEKPISYSAAQIKSYNEENAPVAPAIPTAEDLGLETDASQVAKITENVMTSNGWSINKALVFKSAIFAEADVVEYGTEITCEGREGVLEIENNKSGSVADAVKTFYAAVTSIRDINLDRTFTAKAYADVTVDGVTTRIYAETPASAVYGN